MARDDDDPRAPYKVYEGEELKGTYATRAEARRAQQRLAEAEPQKNFVIKDVLERVVIRGPATAAPNPPRSAPAGIELS